MSKSWHYQINGKSLGPISFDGLAEKVKTGEINPGVTVTADETGESLQAGKVPGLFAQSEPVPVATVEKWFCWIGAKEYGPVNSVQLENWIKEKRVSPEDFIRPGNSKEWVFAGLYKDLFEDAGVSGAADALIRQLHPELFAKKKAAGLDENSPIDEFEPGEEKNPMLEEAQTPVAPQQEEVVQKAPQRRVNNRTSLGEIIMFVPRFFMDLSAVVIEKLAKLFPQTKTAWSILLGSIAALLILGIYVLPPLFKPYYENEEIIEVFDEVYAQILKMRNDGASPEEWTQFSQETNERLKSVFECLEDTADVNDAPRMFLHRAGTYCLANMMRDPKTPSDREQDFLDQMEFAKYKIETKTRAYRRSQGLIP